jgi:outer membrane protein OmpA-like peptidoglycan-associated protein
MNRSDIKIIVWGSLLFFFLCFMCLRTHLHRIPQKLQAKCIEQIELMGGTCTEIAMDGRHARITGTVTDENRIDSLNAALSRIPGIRLITADFHLHENTVKLVRMRSLSKRHLYFNKNSAELPPSARTLIDSLAAFLKKYKNMHLVINGHADAAGSRLFNQILSKKRASTVREAMIHFDCDSARLHAFGLGEQLADSLSLTDSLARRVDFYLKEVSL